MAKSRILVLALIAVAAAASPALAVPFSILTGYDEGTSTLLADGVADTNWKVNGLDATVVIDDAYPIPPWVLNGPSSKWISNRQNPDDIPIGSDLGGLYTFATTFDLTGYVVNGLFNGRFSADNAVLEVRLNGLALPLVGCFVENCHQFWTNFSFGGTIAGVNTLEFDVRNSLITGGPMGFRTEITGDVDPSNPVPEPGTLLLLGSGLTGLAMRRRQKKNS